MNDLGLLPAPNLLRLDHIVADNVSITVVVATTSSHAPCPLCQCPSARVHSHYDRTLADAPWHQVAVRLRLHARRFFCDQATCARAIFTEPLPGVAARYGRRTFRLQEALYLIGLGIGGAGGARLAQALGMASSPDTLLRLLRQAAPPTQPTPRVLGVDDWAFRKGQRYGTILCDLERRCVVDLLPERSAESLAQWLRDHAGVEIISRDRSPLYSQGATMGAPAATQVADRWHLLKNLREAFERLLDRQHSTLRQAAQAVTEQLRPPTLPLAASQEELIPLTRPQRLSQQRRAKRYERYEEVTRLYAQGLPIRRIADQLGMGRHTIRRMVRAEAFPERQGGDLRPSQLNPFKAYLRERWAAGCHNATQLWREIQRQGFAGQGRSVRRYLSTFRAQLPAAQRRQWRGSSQALKPMVPTPSARRASWLLLYPQQALAQAQRRGGDTAHHEQTLLRDRLCNLDPALDSATNLAQAFISIVQTQQAEALEPWLEQAAHSEFPELRHFATGLRQDMKAVIAALTVAWSNGQVEGRVNRLKLIKRQMYGRANFDLLRLRVLAA